MEAEKPAMKDTNFPENIVGRDERVHVDPMTSPPYKWICYLTIESKKRGADGRRIKYKATGFKINFPHVDFNVILTCAHCLYVDGDYAHNVTMTFPGEQPISVQSPPTFGNALYVPPEYISSQKAYSDYDYGLIIQADTNSSGGFGWSTQLSDDELGSLLVTSCGFPGDKPPNTMWITGGPITLVTRHELSFMIDTYGGQSGSPVYTWYKGYWTVVGIDAFGCLPEPCSDNRAVRLTVQMISRFTRQINTISEYQFIRTISSVNFGVDLRCHASGMSQPNGSGGGVVNCQVSPPGDFERFYIYPVEMPPSLATSTDLLKVVIESDKFENCFIRMDGRGVSEASGSGGGVVNCQVGASVWEVFYLVQQLPMIVRRRTYSIVSVAFPHCRLRIDGAKSVSDPVSGGFGTVNCQNYPSISTPTPRQGSYELLFVQEI